MVEPAGRGAAGSPTTPSGPAGATWSWRGAWPTPTSAPSSSTAACSTDRWIGIGARSGSRASDSATTATNETELALEIGMDAVRLLASPPSRWRTPTAPGERVHRYFFAHRLRRPGRRTGCAWALWETTVAGGRRPQVRRPLPEPAQPRSSSPTIGLGADGNVLFGFDGRYARRHGDHASRHRWAWTISSTRTPRARTAIPIAGRSPSPPSDRVGPASAGARFYTQASSLAFRTFNPYENLTDGGVGMGRNFADMDQVTVTVSAAGRPSAGCSCPS